MFALENASGTGQALSIAFLQVTFESRASAYFVKRGGLPRPLPAPVAVAERVVAAECNANDA